MKLVLALTEEDLEVVGAGGEGPITVAEAVIKPLHINSGNFLLTFLNVPKSPLPWRVGIYPVRYNVS
jgi:hypothetical protein